MKSYIIILIFIFGGFSSYSTDKHTVNAIIGDNSFVAKYGWKPNAKTDEILRIKTHLEYVESFLRQRDISKYSPKVQRKRMKLLNHLSAYRQRGMFPSLTGKDTGRKPCFIGDNGTLCAVGYLIAQSAGREVAEEINDKYRTDYLLDMNEPVIEDWATSNGFSLTEFAMIQPTYNWAPEPPVYTWVAYDPGPSKEEIALKAQLDSLTQLHDSTLVVLDSITSFSVEQTDKLEQLNADHQAKLEEFETYKNSSESEISGYKWSTYSLAAALILITSILIFQRKKLAAMR